MQPLTPFFERLADVIRKHYALTNVDIKIISDRAVNFSALKGLELIVIETTKSCTRGH